MRDDNEKTVYERIQAGCHSAGHGTRLQQGGSGPESGYQCQHAQAVGQGIRSRRGASLPGQRQADARTGRAAPTTGRESAAQAGAGDSKKSDGLLRKRVGLRYRFIAQERKAYPVKLLCRLLGVSRGGFYAYLRRQEREPDPKRTEKLACVRHLAKASDHTYGSRRMAKGLRALGYAVGRYQARGLMREAGIWVRYRRRYRVTTNSRHAHPVFPNRLARDFQVTAPNRVWVSDITYIRTVASSMPVGPFGVCLRPMASKAA